VKALAGRIIVAAVTAYVTGSFAVATITAAFGGTLSRATVIIACAFTTITMAGYAVKVFGSLRAKPEYVRTFPDGVTIRSGTPLTDDEAKAVRSIADQRRTEVLDDLAGIGPTDTTALAVVTEEGGRRIVGDTTAGWATVVPTPRRRLPVTIDATTLNDPLDLYRVLHDRVPASPPGTSLEVFVKHDMPWMTVAEIATDFIYDRPDRTLRLTWPATAAVPNPPKD
jgi:hypothetical protein